MSNKKYWLDKRYWILLPIFLVIGLLLFVYVPAEHRKLILLVPLAFWPIYYTWRHLDRVRQSKENR